MSNCTIFEQAPGCWTRANGETENLLIVREYGHDADGKLLVTRTHYTDVTGERITPAAGDIVRLGNCLACCGDVVLSDLNEPGNQIATITLANGQQVDINETITEFEGVYTATDGVLIGTYTNEAGVEVQVYAPKQSVDVNLTPISYVPTATGNTQNLGQVVVDPTGKIWIIDNQGDAQALTMPTFKEARRKYVDPNGSNANNGANESPTLTIAAAYALASLGDTVVVNEGVYAETVTLSKQNTTLAGASGAYGSLTQIASVNATATGTSVRVSDLTVTGAMTHTGTAPLYLHNVTVSGAFTASSNTYREIRQSSLQDGGVTVTAGTTLVEDSKLGTSSFTGAGSVVSLRNVAIDAGECVTIGAGVVYSLSGVTGCVIIQAGAVDAETAALAAGLPAALAEAVATTTFNNLRVTNPDFEAAPTQFVTRDPVTGELEYSDAPVGGSVTYSATSKVTGTDTGTESQIHVTTVDGTATGAVKNVQVYDSASNTWFTIKTSLTTTSLTPVVYDDGWVGAQADIVGNLAKEIRLSDGTIIASGLVTWTGHGLTVGETYYTSQTTAGAYVTPEPTSGLSQKLFTVIDANTIDIQVQEGVEILNDAGTSPTEFAKTVYINSTDPATATVFDDESPPTTNDNTLKADSQNVYYDTLGRAWTYNSATSTYSTYTFPTTVPHGFFAQIPQGTSAANNTLTTPTYSTLSNTTGGGWNPATGTFTAQRAGWYDVSANLLYTLGSWNANTQAGLVLQKNGASVVTGNAFTTTAVTNYYLTSATISTKQYLNAGDTLRLQLYQNSGSAKSTHAPAANTFSIVEVR